MVSKKTSGAGSTPPAEKAVAVKKPASAKKLSPRARRSSSATSPSGSGGWCVVTGASRGLGLAFVTTLLERGYSVAAGFLGKHGERELVLLSSRHEKLRFHELDVTSGESVQRFADWLKAEACDVGLLINNAGVYTEKSTSLDKVDPENVLETIKVNALGPLRVTQALAPLLQAHTKTGLPKVVNISSRQGSLQMVRGAMKIYAKSYGYKMSKAAQNCFTLVLSVDYPSLCCIAVHPGFVQTDMTKFKAALTPEQSSGQVLDLAARLTAEDTGKFMDLTGKPLAW